MWRFDRRAWRGLKAVVLPGLVLLLTAPVLEAGFLYVNVDDPAGSRIYGYVLDEGTGALTAIPGVSPLLTGGFGNGNSASETSAIHHDAVNGRLYASNLGSGTVSVYAIDPLSGGLTALPFSPILTGPATALAVHPSGSPLLAGVGTSVRSFHISPVAAVEAPGSPCAVGVETFSGVFSTDGNYFYTGGDSGGAIAGLMVNPVTGTVTPLPGSPFASAGANPVAYRYDSSGRLMTSNAPDGHLRVFTTAGGVPSPVLGNPFSSGLAGGTHGALHPSGFYMVAGRDGNGVGVYRITGTGAGTILAPVPGSPFASGGTVTGTVAVNQNGTIVMAGNSGTRNLTTFHCDPATGILDGALTQPLNTMGTTGLITGLAYLFVPPQPTDLGITKSDAPDPVCPNSPLGYTLLVTNHGPNPAPGVVATDSLPPVTVLSASGSNWSCNVLGNLVECAYNGIMPVGPAPPIEIAAVAPGTGMTLTNMASVTGHVLDDTPGNDAAVATTWVLPVEATAGGDQTICALGTTAPLGGNTPLLGTGVWSVLGGGTGTFSPSASTPDATFTHTGGIGPIVLKWTVTEPPCPPSGAFVTVTLIPPPSVTISATSPVCAGSTGNTASVPSAGTGGMYVWTLANGTITSGQGTPSITWTAGTASPVTIGVTVSNEITGCSASSTKTVPVNPLPTVTVTAPSAVCAGSFRNTASASVGGITAMYVWTVTNGAITGGQGTSLITWNAGTTSPATITVTVTDSVTGCPASASSQVTIVPIPDPAITVPASACANSTGNTASVADAGPGATYRWSILGGGTITGGQFTPAITWTAGAGPWVAIDVKVSTAIECVAQSSKSVSIRPAPDATITAPAAVCPNSAGHTASVPSAGTGGVYAWTVVNGTITAGQGTPEITWTASGIGPVTLGVTVFNEMTGCSAWKAKSVTLIQPPDATITLSNGALCSGLGEHVASVPEPRGGGMYEWTIANGTVVSELFRGQMISWRSLAGGPVTIGVTVTDRSTGCKARGTKTVTVNPMPDATITAPASVCQGAGGYTASVPDAGSGAEYHWWIDYGYITGSSRERIITFRAGDADFLALNVLVARNGCIEKSLKGIAAVSDPSPPVLLSPANGQDGYLGGTVSWQLQYYTEYDVYLDTENPPAKLLKSLPRDSSSASLPPWLPGVTYYWRVVARNACGSAASPVWSFTRGFCPWTGVPPSLVSPPNGATGLAVLQPLVWAPVAGASHYKVHLGTSITNMKAIREVPATDVSSESGVVAITLNPGTTYVWQVEATPACGTAKLALSPVWEFTTAPGSPRLTGSTPGSVNRWQGAVLKLNGTGFVPGGQLFAEYGGYELEVVVPGSENLTVDELQGTIQPDPRAPAGWYDVGVKEGETVQAGLNAAFAMTAFTDVTEGDFYYLSSARVADAGIMEEDADPVTEGPQFLPGLFVTRAHLARYLARAHQWQRERTVALPAATCTVPDFPDVPCDHPDWLPIHWIKAWGVTQGSPCAQGLCYRPDGHANRGELVTFLERLRLGPVLLGTLLETIGEMDPGCSSPWPACAGWTDPGMQVAGWPRREVNVAFNERLTTGCSGTPGNNLAMCVDSLVTRGQAAEFLARATGLTWGP
ncbi:MAG: hypothetical protein DIJKHBIC_03044 [Thermoanaerobaculia bacterium]|nr:hypothetical protein [Thermoanaerobaculia bacterium]